jgi:Ras-related protein Rab-5C
MIEEEPTSTKVVLLGETAVGKSSLISRFIEDKFQTNYTTTMTGAFFSKEVFYEKYQKKIKYEIWDTAGQEKYRALNKMFYQDTKVIILVIDITRKDTYQAILNYWYKELKENAPQNIIIALAANKNDLYEYEEVTNEELDQYAKSINAIYQKTSALKGQGITELFNVIGEKILSSENHEEIETKQVNENKKIRLESSLRDIELSKTNSDISDKNVNKQSKKGCC